MAKYRTDNRDKLEERRKRNKRIGLGGFPGGDLMDKLAQIGDIWNIGESNKPEETPEADLYQPDPSSIANFEKKYEYLRDLASKAPTYDHQKAYIDEMYNLINDLYPGRGQRMSEIGQFGGMGAQGQLGQMAGLGEDYIQNDMALSRFGQEFGAPTDDPETDSMYMDAIAQAMTNPELAGQYYGKDSNPNLIQSGMSRLESLLPNKTYEEIQREKRLERSGFDL